MRRSRAAEARRATEIGKRIKEAQGVKEPASKVVEAPKKKQKAKPAKKSK